MKFVATPTDIEGLLVVEPRFFEDERGYFLESYNSRDFADLGILDTFVQDNQSRSRKGTLRGLHFQKRRPQAKLVQVLSGRVFDVAVDLRNDSPTFGRWHGVTLDGARKTMLYLPAGFAHGFLTLSETADVAYKCSDYYDPEDEDGLVWNDPGVGIEWPLEGIGTPLLSPKDERLPRLPESR